jgi:putative colanic acid biosynthesis glycosyltransferase
MSMQIKVLQVNSCYRSGSTGKIVFDLHSELRKDGMGSLVCYGRGSKVVEENVYKISNPLLVNLHALRTRLFGLPFEGSLVPTQYLKAIIQKEKPDIVHLQCINGYIVNIYEIVDFLKKHKIPTVLTLHAEFIHTGSCGHAYECEKWKTGCGQCPQLWEASRSWYFDRTKTAWKKMKKAFENFDTLRITTVSSWLAYRAIQSPILEKYPVTVIHNGLDSERTFKPIFQSSIREKHDIKENKIIFYATPQFIVNGVDVKGGHYVLSLAERLKGHPIKILIAGSYSKKIILPDNVICVGRISNQQNLAAYYSMADLTLLVSRRETFSMVCAESLCCGTPVVGFEAGGPETIALSEYSQFVPQGDMEALERIVLEWIHKKEKMPSNTLSDIARNKYSKERMYKEYRIVYKELLNNKDHKYVQE